MSIPRGSVGGLRGFGARAYQVLLVMPLLSLGYVGLSHEGDLPVVIPALVLLNCATLFLVLLSMPSFRMPVFEIGTMFAIVVAIYGFVPLVQYQLRGGVYGAASDNRLWISQPTAEEVGMVGWAHVLFLMSFGIAYLLMRRGSEFEVHSSEDVSWKQLMFAGVLLAAAMVVQFGIEMAFDLSYSTYVESYLVVEKLPQSLRQVYGHLPGIIFTLKLLLLAGVFVRSRNPMYIVGIWLGIELLMLLVRMGWRTYLMLSIGATLLFFHVYVRRVNSLILAGIGAAVLGGFLVLGMMRNSALEDAFVGTGVWEQSNEMEAVFANAVDLMQQRARSTIRLPPEAQISELTAFIPQQLLPFQKFDYAQWYAQQTYVTDGYTSAFGTIAQALAGVGWWELTGRGLLIGLIFGGLHRFFANRSERWLYLVAYAWLIAMSYQSFRATTLQPFAVFCLEALPVFMVMRLVPREDARRPVTRFEG